jgi:formylglycine-generating enzyme required for sulfatase activity
MLICIGIVPGRAEKRVALVIGNGTYSKVGQLPNPANDAGAIAALLRNAGFDVVQSQTNLDLSSMRRALRDFASAVRDADVVVIFYAGHGIEVNGVNYLIPVDAVLERDIDVEDETISLDRVNQIIEPAKRLRVVILDACRDNPFASGMKRTVGKRSIGRGLARVDVPTADTLIAFAAKAGSTAADGSGPNSPYTTALLEYLVTPGLDVRLVLGRVRDQVLASTGGKQEPFVYGSLGGAEISLVPAAKPAPAPHPTSEAAQSWAVIKDTTDIQVLEAFIKRYGDSFYADIARARLAKVAPPVLVGPCGVATTVSLSSRSAKPLSAGEECALKPKDVFRECDKCPEMVVVPTGSFTMGSPASEGNGDEGPQHAVTFEKQLAVGRFAVTFDEWDACAADGGCNGYEAMDQGWGRGRRPVINVSWDDASAYAAWLSRKTGKTYRLLSEAEREYVARAGTTTPFWLGASIATSQANYDGTVAYGNESTGEHRGKTLPVGSFQPNDWGLYQVLGNVWEWVADCYHDSYTGAPTDGSAWTSAECSFRVLRGGSWNSSARDLRSANRYWYATDVRRADGGLRLARTL